MSNIQIESSTEKENSTRIFEFILIPSITCAQKLCAFLLHGQIEEMGRNAQEGSKREYLITSSTTISTYHNPILTKKIAYTSSKIVKYFR